MPAKKQTPETFLICTAIDYPSGPPHAGHLYEKVAADVVARWHRLNGEKVHFSTGLDCHGQKIERAAKAAGKTPEAFVDEKAALFLELCKLYHISYDDFIQTREERHKRVVEKFFHLLEKDISKGTYKGPYCVDCETFYTEKDLVDGNCPVHKKKVEHVTEEGYFFALSKYQKPLIEYIQKHPDFIQPEKRRNEVLSRLREPVRDLCMTRKQVTWGIPFPLDTQYTTFVWTEALLNYLTSAGYPKMKGWPSFNIVGKDILWHHSVIFGSMLLSAGLPLHHFFVHGFVTMGGEKMSKSIGNVLDPLELARRYPTDTIRYFLIRNIPFGEDGDFTEAALKERINGELVSDLGNLASRILTLAGKFEGKIEGKVVLEQKLDLAKLHGHFRTMELHHALDTVFQFVRACNAYISETEPWKKQGKELGEIMYNLLESLRIIGILISPFLPETAEKIDAQLGVKQGTLKDAHFRDWKGSPQKGEHLFQRVQ